MKLRNTICLMAAAGLLSACAAVTASDSASKPAAAKSGIFGMSTTSDVVVDNEKAFSGMNQVVIGSFKVAFVENKKASNKAGGGLMGNGMGGRAKANMELKGLDMATMQFITDQAYKDFEAKLASAGYTVADRAQLLTYGGYANASAKPSPFKEEASFFGVSSDTTYMTPTGFGPVQFFQGEYGKNDGMGFNSGAYAIANKFAGEKGIPVISVAYLVDFANTGGHGGAWSMSASMQVSQGISVAPGSGIMKVGGWQGGTFSANPNGSVKLGQAVGSDVPFGTVETTTSGAEVAAETALNVVTAVLGGGTNQTRDFAITADPAKYQQIASTVLMQANTNVIGKMASMK